MLLTALAVVGSMGGASPWTVLAQEAGSADGEFRQLNPGGAAILLRRSPVQSELKLTDEQRTVFRDKMAKILETHRQAMAKLRGASADEQDAQKEAIWRAEREAADKVIGEVLSAAQLKRLKQIQYQEEGLQVFTYMEVRKALELTDDQASKARVIAKEYIDANNKLQAPKRFRNSDYEGLKRTYQEKMQNLLTEHQRTTWKALIGEPFVLK
jgi:hypothetical protein